MVKSLKVGQLVRVVTSVKSEEGKTLVSHGRKGHVSAVSEDGSVVVQFPTRAVPLTSVDVMNCLKTCRGRPRKLRPEITTPSSAG